MFIKRIGHRGSCFEIFTTWIVAGCAVHVHYLSKFHNVHDIQYPSTREIHQFDVFSRGLPIPTASLRKFWGMAICSYFYEAMPEGTSVERLERWESQARPAPASHVWKTSTKTAWTRKYGNFLTKIMSIYCKTVCRKFKDLDDFKRCGWRLLTPIGLQACYMPFAAYRQAVQADLEAEDVELWLFHGTVPLPQKGLFYQILVK